MDTYLPTETYRQLVEALATIKPYPFTGKIEPHQVHEALGEIAQIWPDVIKEDNA